MIMEFLNEGSGQHHITDEGCLYDQKLLHGVSSLPDNDCLAFVPFYNCGRSGRFLFVLAVRYDVINSDLDINTNVFKPGGNSLCGNISRGGDQWFPDTL